MPNNLMCKSIALKFKSITYKVRFPNLKILEPNAINKLKVWTSNFHKLSNYKYNFLKWNRTCNNVNLNLSNSKIKSVLYKSKYKTLPKYNNNFLHFKLTLKIVKTTFKVLSKRLNN